MTLALNPFLIHAQKIIICCPPLNAVVSVWRSSEEYCMLHTITHFLSVMDYYLMPTSEKADVCGGVVRSPRTVPTLCICCRPFTHHSWTLLGIQHRILIRQGYIILFIQKLQTVLLPISKDLKVNTIASMLKKLECYYLGQRECRNNRQTRERKGGREGERR